MSERPELSMGTLARVARRWLAYDLEVGLGLQWEDLPGLTAAEFDAVYGWLEELGRIMRERVDFETKDDRDEWLATWEMAVEG